MLKVYCAEIGELPVDGGDLPLSEYRRESLSKLKPPLSRRRGIGAELLLNHAVLRHCPDCRIPLDIGCKSGGKPFLRNGEVFFSLSHSGSYVLCAVSDKELGADIQKLRKCSLKLSERFFKADEHEWLINAADRDYEFTRLWTLKESYIKATGKGLAQELASFSVLSEETAGEWHFAHATFDAYHLAVCSRERADKLSYEMIKLL